MRRRKASGRITRYLRLLRAHGLIRKVSGTRYYRVTPKGHQVMTTALKLLGAAFEYPSLLGLLSDSIRVTVAQPQAHGVPRSHPTGSKGTERHPRASHRSMGRVPAPLGHRSYAYKNPGVWGRAPRTNRSGGRPRCATWPANPQDNSISGDLESESGPGKLVRMDPCYKSAPDTNYAQWMFHGLQHKMLVKKTR